MCSIQLGVRMCLLMLVTATCLTMMLHTHLWDFVSQIGLYKSQKMMCIYTVISNGNTFWMKLIFPPYILNIIS